jgi:hypothetical protein
LALVSAPIVGVVTYLGLLLTLTVAGNATAGAGTTTPATSTTTSVPTTSTTTSATGSPTTASSRVTTTPVTGQQLLSSTMNAFTSQRAVDWVFRLSAHGGSLHEVVSSGLKDGTMSESLTTGGEVSTVKMVLDGQVFFEGNAPGLVAVENLKPAAARREVNEWVQVPRSSPFFAGYANNLTVASAVGELYLGGTVKALSPTTVNGQKVMAVRESLSSKGSTTVETLYVRASGMALPVEAVLAIDGVPGTIVYGPWSKPPAAKVPGRSVPLMDSWVNNP